MKTEALLKALASIRRRLARLDDEAAREALLEVTELEAKLNQSDDLAVGAIVSALTS